MNEDKRIAHKYFTLISEKVEKISLLILSYDDIYFTFMMHPGSCAKIRNQQNMILLLKRKFFVDHLSLFNSGNTTTYLRYNISFTFSIIFSFCYFLPPSFKVCKVK